VVPRCAVLELYVRRGGRAVDGVARPFGFDYEDRGAVVGPWAVLDAARDDEELSGSELGRGDQGWSNVASTAARSIALGSVISFSSIVVVGR
jgi:hypothetical protein